MIPSGFDSEAAGRASAVALVVVVLTAGAATALGGPVSGTIFGTGDDGAVRPTAVDGPIPRAGSAFDWDDAAGEVVQLNEQQMAPPFGGGSVNELDVRTVANESHVGFRLQWSDPTNDTSIGSPRSFSDAVAIMLRNGEKPPITMGADGSPVDIWYWRASWQFEQPPSGGDMYSYPHPDNETRPGTAAGNPLSKAVFDRHAQNYYARGFGSLSYAPVQNVQASGHRTDEGWSVTFVRERATEGTHDALFNGSKTVHLAFAVWNGSEGEVNGQKSITLNFVQLNTETGELSVGDDGSSPGDATDGGDGGDGTGSGSSGTLISPPVLAVIAIVALGVTSWIGVYWEARRRS
jgi:DMSO reductase family type II enzyme heme b subunit